MTGRQAAQMDNAAADTEGGSMESTVTDWFLYLVRCRHGTLYTGITTDVPRRFAEHQAGGGKAARYLRGKGPLQLVYTTSAGNRAQAAVLEYRVKRLSRSQKLQLIAGDASFLALEGLADR